jgi:dTDP-4-amino-4,6-dideoxygalactose transaminase
VERRRHFARRYRRILGSVPGLQLPDDPSYGTTNYQSFWIVLPDDFPVSRNELSQRMLDRGISTRRGIMAAHLEPAYAGTPHCELPVTERLTAQSLIVPLFHEMTEAEQDLVAEVVLEVAGARAA